MVLVQGDTTTTCIGSLAAFYRQIPVGHIEAGLRTNDKNNPFPEEINRRITGCITDLHFAPTETARQSLLLENTNPKNIFVTGNTVVDALEYSVRKGYEFAVPELKSIMSYFSYASSAQVNYEYTPNGYSVNSPYSFVLQLPSSIKVIQVDGEDVIGYRENNFLVPAGKHNITVSANSSQFSTVALQPQLLSFTGNLLDIKYDMFKAFYIDNIKKEGNVWDKTVRFDVQPKKKPIANA